MVAVAPRCTLFGLLCRSAEPRVAGNGAMMAFVDRSCSGLRWVAKCSCPMSRCWRKWQTDWLATIIVSRWQWSCLFSVSSFAWSAEVKTLRSMARQATIRSITTGLGLLCPAHDGGEQTEVVGDGPRILKWKNGPPGDEGNHSGEQGMDVQAVSSRNALLVTYPHPYAGLTGSCRDRDTLGPLLRFRWTCGLFPATHDHRSNAILILRRAESIERVNHLAGV